MSSVSSYKTYLIRPVQACHHSAFCWVEATPSRAWQRYLLDTPDLH